MADVLAELVARITADASELKKALSESEKDVQGLGKSIEKETKSWQEQFKAVGKLALGMGATITAAMGLAIKSFTGVGSELHDLSLKTGVSVRALAGLQYAAEQNGASLGTVEMAIRRVAMAMSDAESETSESGRAFAKLGIALTDLQGLNPEQQFLKIAGAIANIPDPMVKAALAVDLFGRSGTDILPMLSEGAVGLQKMMAAGVALTGWTEEGAKSADDLGDAFGTLKTSTMGVFNAIGLSLAPTLTDLVNKISGVISNIKDWSNEHPLLSRVIFEFTLVIGVLATALGGILLLGSQLVIAYGVMSTFIMTILIPTIVAAVTATWSWVAAQLAAIAASGLGIPIAIAAAAAIGMLTTGIILLAKNQISQMDATNEAAKSIENLGDASRRTELLAERLTNTVHGVKQAMASATWMAEGYTYSMQLFTQAEIDAAKASGKKVTELKSQSDITADNIIKTGDYIKAIDSATTSVGQLTASYNELKTALNEKIKLSLVGAVGKTSAEIQAEYEFMQAQSVTQFASRAYAVEYIEKYAGPEHAAIMRAELATLPSDYKFQEGGIITQPTFGLIGEAGPEAIIPLNEAGGIGGITINFTQPVFFDREDTMNRFVDMIRKGIQRQDRIRFGGAYNG